MISTKTAFRTTVGLIWVLALWHAWTARGLFVDGANFLVHITIHEGFFLFYSPRVYAMFLGQIPIWIALQFGVTDLHLLGQLLSLGLFGLPTIFYTMALWRAKDDPVLLATVIATIAIVFMTTSFFIVGEYNTLYALTLMIAVWLATAQGLTLRDAVVVALASFLAIRTYETMLYLGPILAGLTIWKLWLASFRPVVPALLYGVSIVCYGFAHVVALDSVVNPYSEEHLEETWDMALDFWQNIQFDLVLGAALIVVVWGLLRPPALATVRPYRWGGLLLALLALSPLLALGDTLVRPLAKSQYVARTVSGLIVAALIILVVLYRSRAGERVPVFAALRTPQAGRRFLAFAFAMLLAGLPSDIFLTRTWVSYLDAMRQVVVANKGPVAFEDTPFATRPHSLLVENWVLTSQSLLLRSRPGDGIIAPPRDYTGWTPYTLDKPPDLGRYFWQD
ncbi:MAG: hypothetical protein KIT25_07005 [Enhydrobacter sp.]|nr:MAG: hypothetical protein KIT25_07005 [Enhydrobacter sp.]